jgi:hypothetical protein
MDSASGFVRPADGSLLKLQPYASNHQRQTAKRGVVHAGQGRRRSGRDSRRRDVSDYTSLPLKIVATFKALTVEQYAALVAERDAAVKAAEWRWLLAKASNRGLANWCESAGTFWVQGGEFLQAKFAAGLPEDNEQHRHAITESLDPNPRPQPGEWP